MSIFKLYPQADATIYSTDPSKNTGLDEILEISKVVGSPNQVSRSLIKFNNNDINTILSIVSSSSYNIYLKMFNVLTQNITNNYALEFRPLGQDWVMGTGRFENIPEITDGVSWNYSDGSSSQTSWITGSSNITGSSFAPVSGGGSWFNGLVTQSFVNYTNNFDVNVNVTSIINQWSSGSYSNYGFIIKTSNLTESSNVDLGSIRYFSRDTNTIYSPYLEFKWDDSEYLTGSNQVINSNNIVISTNNNKVFYKQGEIVKFRFNIREKFPQRAFITSSNYITNKVLSSASYYKIEDLDTKETIIDFDNNYTKISCDSEGSYIKIYTEGLQPERYYKIIYKIVKNSQVEIIDNNHLFKVK
jgi:hypothetical protein